MKPDYGLDAPGVIRNLAIGGLSAVIVGSTRPGVTTTLLPATRADRMIASLWFFLTGFILLIESAWMLYSSKAGCPVLSKCIPGANGPLLLVA